MLIYVAFYNLNKKKSYCNFQKQVKYMMYYCISNLNKQTFFHYRVSMKNNKKKWSRRKLNHKVYNLSPEMFRYQSTECSRAGLMSKSFFKSL